MPAVLRSTVTPGIAVVIASVALTGCGPSSLPATATPGPAGSSAADAHDAADVAFTQTMVRHDRQTMTMAAQMAPSLAQSRQVKELASRIASAEQSRISTMVGWLQTWDAAIPDPNAESMDPSSIAADSATGRAGSESGDSGLLNSEQLTELGLSRGRPWDTMFARLMITHDTGGVHVAKDELAHGHNASARALAQNLVTAATAEIDQLHEMLGS